MMRFSNEVQTWERIVDKLSTLIKNGLFSFLSWLFNLKQIYRDLYFKLLEFFPDKIKSI